MRWYISNIRKPPSYVALPRPYRPCVDLPRPNRPCVDLSRPNRPCVDLTGRVLTYHVLTGRVLTYLITVDSRMHNRQTSSQHTAYIIYMRHLTDAGSFSCMSRGIYLMELLHYTALYYVCIHDYTCISSMCISCKKIIYYQTPRYLPQPLISLVKNGTKI